MRILKAEFQNFGSYKSLSFDYSNLGLSLVTGTTGAGKSTLVDAPCWILFGITSKDGAADDVISWDAEEPTRGVLKIEFADFQILYVSRIRGGNKNDLYWSWNTLDPSDFPIRGKDLVDSQKQLEALLGVTAQQYLLSSYFHQFSKMDSFFFSKAKERRELLESICDLEFPQSLGLAAQDAKREAKKAADLAERKHVTAATKLESAQAKLEEIKDKHSKFEAERDEAIVNKRKFLSQLQSQLYIENPPQRKLDLQKALAEEYAARRQAEKDLAGAMARDCPTCKRPFEHSEENIRKLSCTLETHNKVISDIEGSRSSIEEQVRIYNKIELVKADLLSIKNENPFTAYLQSSSAEADRAKLAALDADEAQAKEEYNLFLLEKVYDLSTDLRAQLLQSTVTGLEKDTNRCLETHFDSAIRVSLSLQDSDKVEVTIRNDGFECSYKQLSGGQRRMLTLAFALSVMERTANKAGFHPSLLVFDEALNGLDSDLKSKAFGLFQELSKKHESVLLMDHSEEMRELFDSKIIVTKIGTESHVERG